MREQLAQLSSETKALRTAFAERSPAPRCPPADLRDMLAEHSRESFLSLGNMLNCQLEALENRLPPEPILRRPPPPSRPTRPVRCAIPNRDSPRKWLESPPANQGLPQSESVCGRNNHVSTSLRTNKFRKLGCFYRILTTKALKVVHSRGAHAPLEIRSESDSDTV